MTQGTVKWFDTNKGFGFITPDGSGQDIYVHYCDFADRTHRVLQQNERVEFDIIGGQQGPRADNVRKL